MDQNHKFCSTKCTALRKPGGGLTQLLVKTVLVLLLALPGIFFPGLFAQAYTMQADTDSTLHLEDMTYRLSYTGSYRDFTIPAGVEGKYLCLEARGGDGGTIDFRNDILHPGKGGQGAQVFGVFKVGSGINEIPVGATIRTIIGAAGESYSNHGQSARHSGGGGGGTGVLFLPGNLDPAKADAKDWTILMVAGAGGGGHARWGGNILHGLPGNDSENDNGGRTDQGGYLKSCDWSDKHLLRWGGSINGGGGTGYQLIKEVCTDSEWDGPFGNAENTETNWSYGRKAGGGYGGFQMNNEKMQPVGAEGGYDAMNNIDEICNFGGFGFGSGGVGYGKLCGGGGGYTGGDGGVNGGGGGSYVNQQYVLPWTSAKKKNGNTRNSEDGYVQYLFSDVFVVQSLAKGQQYTNDKSKNLLIYDNYTLRWQKDGNLVLYDEEFSAANAKWTSGTEGRGKKLIFQNDGNLVIRDANDNAIWTSATANDQQGGKGGCKLILSPIGKLDMFNVDQKSIWSSQ